MAKVVISVSIDADVHKVFLKKVGKGNVSHIIDKFLKNYIQVQQESLVGFNLELEKQELTVLQEQEVNLATKIQIKKDAITLVEEGLIQKQHEASLVAAVEKQYPVCYSCAQEIIGKPIALKHERVICKGCFLTSSSGDIERWNKAPE